MKTKDPIQGRDLLRIGSGVWLLVPLEDVRRTSSSLVPIIEENGMNFPFDFGHTDHVTWAITVVQPIGRDSWPR